MSLDIAAKPKLSLDFYQYVEEAAKLENMEDNNNSTKRILWEKMGNELIVLGFAANRISVIIQRNIERRIKVETGKPAKINTGWYYTVMDQNNWTDQSFDRMPKTASDERLDIVPDVSQSRPNENAGLLRVLDRFGEHLDMFCDYLRHNDFASLLEPEILEDATIRLNAYCDNIGDSMNNKQIIPRNMTFIFWQLYNGAPSINILFGEFFDKIKAIHVRDRAHQKQTNQIITSKELKKIMSRMMVNVPDSLEFGSQNEARLAGFFGQQCPRCNGYRTVIMEDNKNMVKCIRCFGRYGNKFVRQPQFLCHRCRFVLVPSQVKDGFCAHCGHEVILPEEMKP